VSARTLRPLPGAGAASARSPLTTGTGSIAPARRSPTQQAGDAAEAHALAYLCGRGLILLARNVSCKLGELDLIMRDGEQIVFVEVRLRSRGDYGGAAASVGHAKQMRLRRAAQRWLTGRYGDRWPACRFDVCAVHPGGIDWITGAF
jgi:putative endonuclease